ncbi:hypothetical protein [Chryseobacterium sp. KMC2]|uniref:hypothetical protein n=1 Tax=Chryseobacterium sp. KMC2 TaxID=2800705 RepID=UPI001924F6FA|nr:hypothetical protein [Chryseobacterium sp. KMC2]MBL3550438.1 hypothetical protein [Chryseobacterium sp. KMC2]
MKPNIKIVPLISRQDNPFDGQSTIVHAFKIINKSFFGAYDVEVIANYYTIKQANDGIVHRLYEKLPLKTNKVSYIKRFIPFKKKYGDNCAQFFTDEDLSHVVKNNKYVRFQVTARHSVTGLSNIQTFEFVNHTYIKNGFFVAGNSEKIQEN